MKPDKLKKGDAVGIFVPSSPVKESYRISGLKQVKKLGFTPVEVDHILAGNHFLAKRPEENFADIQFFLNNDQIKAIWAARGGYGSNYLLPLLHRLKLGKAKIIIGSSDVSYLLWFLLDHFKMVVFYGPMAFASIAEGHFDEDNLYSVLAGDYQQMTIKGQVLQPGRSAGILTGGCLSNFVSLIGTPYELNVQDRILLLEDQNERPYRLHRMFWQIHEAGILKRVKGLLLGEFPQCFINADERVHFWQQLQDLLTPYHIPIITDLPVGHGENIHTIPLGIHVHLNTDDFAGFMIEEKGVQ